MSRFLSPRAAALAPYTPGEQPQDQAYIKLNTNESPFPPSPKVLQAVSRAEIRKLNLYSDPTCCRLNAALAARYGLQPENVIDSGICTMCHSDEFWSHRKTNGLRGVQGGMICL